MVACLEEAAGHELLDFSDIHHKVVWNVLDPFPVSVAVEDLQSGYRLGGEQGESAPVYVACEIEISPLLVVLIRSRIIDHLRHVSS